MMREGIGGLWFEFVLGKNMNFDFREMERPTQGFIGLTMAKRMEGAQI